MACLFQTAGASHDVRACLRYASGMTRRSSEASGASPPASATPQNFESALAELEDIVRRMESHEVSLDESLRLYERGSFLIGHCQKRLDQAEKQIEQLTRGRDGRLESRPAAARDHEGA